MSRLDVAEELGRGNSVLEVQRGDIFLTQGNSIKARIIRWFQRSKGEEPTLFNHAGLFLNNTTLFRAISMEALWRVRTGRFWRFYHGDTSRVAIYRRRRLMSEQRLVVVDKALDFYGNQYGVLKILAHALDRMLFDTYLFRRLAKLDRYPICSYLVARCFDEVDIWIGASPSRAQPDDIGDYIIEHPDLFETIMPLRYI